MTTDGTEPTTADVQHAGFISLKEHQKRVKRQAKKYQAEHRGRLEEKARANNAEAEIAEVRAQIAHKQVAHL